MQAPDFWHKRGPLSCLLAPLGWLYGLGSCLRQMTGKGQKLDVPVICVGNLVAGGAGKTPVALSLASILQQAGFVPHFVSRGYGGTLKGPLQVDPAQHRAGDVGDEPLLLAAVAPAWIARDRAAGARQAVEAGADVVILDDGFQNPALHKDLSILVVDGQQGLGNGRLIPAGPLREFPASGVKRADAIVVMGETSGTCDKQLSAWAGKLPRLAARLQPRTEQLETFNGRPLLAFAGIGRPGKFYGTLRQLGVNLIETLDFPDHHPYSAEDLSSLFAKAEALGAALITTEKDALRLPPEVRELVLVLPVSVQWDRSEDLLHCLAPILATKQGLS